MIIRLNFSAAVDGHGAAALGLGVLAADQVPLDEELAVDASPARRRRRRAARSEALMRQDALAQDLLDLGAVLRRGAADEGEVGQIAGQADAAADDDVRLGAGAAQPFAAVSSQIVRVPRQSFRSR